MAGDLFDLFWTSVEPLFGCHGNVSSANSEKLPLVWLCRDLTFDLWLLLFAANGRYGSTLFRRCAFYLPMLEPLNAGSAFICLRTEDYEDMHCSPGFIGRDITSVTSPNFVTSLWRKPTHFLATLINYDVIVTQRTVAFYRLCITGLDCKAKCCGRFFHQLATPAELKRHHKKEKNCLQLGWYAVAASGFHLCNMGSNPICHLALSSCA